VPAPVVSAQLVESLIVGGAETLAARVATARAAAGAGSWLYSLRRGGPLADRIQPPARLRELGLARESIRRPAAMLASVRAGRRALLDHLRHDGVEVVQTHLPEANFWGLLLALGRALPTVATVHSNDEFHYGPDDGPVRRALRRRAYRLLLQRCDAVVAVSEAVRDSLAEQLGLDARGAEAITVIPNAVDVPAPLPAAERAAVRAALGVGPDEILLLGAGRLTALKSFGDLVAVTVRLRAAGHPVRAVIAGEGEERAALEGAIATSGAPDAVQLLGLRDDLDRLYQAADLFVLTSRWEGLPLVALEAMAAGCPFVGYRIAGTADLVTDGRDGVLAPVADTAALADAIAALIADPSRCRALAAAGGDLVRSRYDFREAVARLDALYARIRRRGSGPAGD
jgi:glycosyltransferase involved in cell wall biosynthesis